MSVVLSSAPAACILLMIGTVGCQRFSLPAPPTSFVLIVADTLRRDHLGLYGYERDTSPRLDAWSTRGSVFDRAFSTSPWTLPTFGTLFTGLLPSSHGAGYGKGRHRLRDRLPTLAETLGAKGFATGAFVSNPFLGKKGGIARGFQSFDNAYTRAEETNPVKKIPRYRDARVTTERALAWLDEHRVEADFFLVVHYFDPHAPLRPPLPYRGRFSNQYSGPLRYPLSYRDVEDRRDNLTAADRAFVRAAYDEEIAFTDHEIGRFLEGLVDRGLFEQSLVIFTADHGEELLERGVFDHGHTLFNEMLRIPLVVWGPGVVPGRHDVPVSSVDVMATVLDAFEIETPTESQGVSLWDLITGSADSLPSRFLFAETTTNSLDRAVIRGSQKAVLSEDGSKIRVYDWVADPTEFTDLMVAAESSTLAFAEEARAVLPIPYDQGFVEPVDFSPDERGALLALGYLE